MALKKAPEARKWRYGKHVAWRKVAGEAVILNVDTAVYYSLDSVGLRMWELLGGGKTSEEIGRVMAEEYDAPPEQIQRDIEALSRLLIREKLIEPSA
jgi:hypothetical protein